MTAFSRNEIIQNNHSIIWQLKSVNHKYLEISIHLPDHIKYLEQIISKKIKKCVFRDLLKWPGVIIKKNINDIQDTLILSHFESTLNKLSEFRLIEEYRKKLKNKINAIDIKYDPNRLEQEIAIIISKTDINEELDQRLVGLKLNFILQEVMRESNTITSKAININIIESAIEIKMLTEQIREQVQNIE
ncbi:hypothetical protein GQX74_015784 [Glossina fuscipes]|nr:hypothetical protein GQX74_015784 [Glossina fuscipes]